MAPGDDVVSLASIEDQGVAPFLQCDICAELQGQALAVLFRNSLEVIDLLISVEDVHLT